MAGEAPGNSGGGPGPGDYSLCLNCGELLVYGENMITELAPKTWAEDAVQEAKDEEDGDLVSAAQFVRQIRAGQRMIRERGRFADGRGTPT